jgi:hypothetical protein
MKNVLVLAGLALGAAALVQRSRSAPGAGGGPIRLPGPGVGLGDAVKTGLSAVGVRARPGCGCPERAEALNRLVQFGGGP